MNTLIPTVIFLTYQARSPNSFTWFRPTSSSSFKRLLQFYLKACQNSTRVTRRRHLKTWPSTHIICWSSLGGESFTRSVCVFHFLQLQKCELMSKLFSLLQLVSGFFLHNIRAHLRNVQDLLILLGYASTDDHTMELG